MDTDMNLTELVVKKIEYLCCQKERLTPYKISKNGEFNPRTLNHILNGTNKDAKLSTINKICKGLNISIQEFFNDDLFK